MDFPYRNICIHTLLEYYEKDFADTFFSIYQIEHPEIAPKLLGRDHYAHQVNELNIYFQNSLADWELEIDHILKNSKKENIQRYFEELELQIKTLSVLHFNLMEDVLKWSSVNYELFCDDVALNSNNYFKNYPNKLFYCIENVPEIYDMDHLTHFLDYVDKRRKKFIEMANIHLQNYQEIFSVYDENIFIDIKAFEFFKCLQKELVSKKTDYADYSFIYTMFEKDGFFKPTIKHLTFIRFLDKNYSTSFEERDYNQFKYKQQKVKLKAYSHLNRNSG